MGQAWAKTSALPSRSLTLFQRANAHRVFGFCQQFFGFGAGFGCACLQNIFNARGMGNQVVVHINGERYNVFPDYCQGLHFLESNRYGRVTIDDVKVDDFHHITKIEVTQRNTGK